jgi:hypothetical protein
MENKFYTYIHLNPETNQIFYVGKGTGNRAFVKPQRNDQWKKYVNDLKEDYKIIFIKKNQTSEEAEALEQMLITKIGSVVEGGTLLNRDGLGFNPDMIVSVTNLEVKPNTDAKYFGWSDEEIINDLLEFPNLELGTKAQERFEILSDKFNDVYEELEEYNEEILDALVQFYDDVEILINDFKLSVCDQQEVLENLTIIEEEIEEFKTEYRDKINELIEGLLLSIENELNNIRMENTANIP